MDNKTIEQNKPDQQNGVKHMKPHKKSVYERSMELVQQKAKLYEEGEAIRHRNEFKEISQSSQIKFYHAPPEKSPRKKSDLPWDENGNLIVDENNKKDNKKKNEEDLYNQNKKLSLSERKEINDEFLERNFKTKKKKERTEKVVLPPKSDFNSFLDRQEAAGRKKTKSPPKTKQKSYLSQKSKNLANKALSRTNHRKPDVDEYTFRPDLSKSQNYPSKGIPIHMAEAHAVLKDIGLHSLQVEVIADQTKECTFAPTFECPKEKRDKLAKRFESRQQKQKAENQSSKTCSQQTETEEDDYLTETNLCKTQTPKKSPFSEVVKIKVHHEQYEKYSPNKKPSDHEKRRH